MVAAHSGPMEVFQLLRHMVLRCTLKFAVNIVPKVKFIVNPHRGMKRELCNGLSYGLLSVIKRAEHFLLSSLPLVLDL